jgi:hypothetical protein
MDSSNNSTEDKNEKSFYQYESFQRGVIIFLLLVLIGLIIVYLVQNRKKVAATAAGAISSSPTSAMELSGTPVQ